MNNKSFLIEINTDNFHTYLSCNNQINIYVKPNSSKCSIHYDMKKKKLIAYLKSPPIDNKANEELIKIFNKYLKLRVDIKRGHTSKNKVLIVHM